MVTSQLAVDEALVECLRPTTSVVRCATFRFLLYINEKAMVNSKIQINRLSWRENNHNQLMAYYNLLGPVVLLEK